MTGQDTNLNELRSLAIDLMRAEAWDRLMAEKPNLQRDGQYWLSVWGPACAVAAFHEGRSDARDQLEALIEAGFHDYATHADMFSGSFATAPGWDDLRERMDANKPLPPVEVTDWPSAAPVAVLGLDRLDAAGEARLVARLPSPSGTASETALAVLSWVTSRWRHSSANHVEEPDANIVLDRVEQGARFACREYTILLTQALNAVSIPARVLALFRDDYYTGMGTGHATTEAWLDDLGRWVVLDGQNGATWQDPRGDLLGVEVLQGMLLAGHTPRFVGSGPNFDPSAAEDWMVYFRHCSIAGTAWRSGSFIPVLEGRSVLESRPLLRGPELVHPDLSEISTSICDMDGVPAVQFGTGHPYATGFVLDDGAGNRCCLGLSDRAALDAPPGEHSWRVSTRTPFGTVGASTLSYVTRSR